MFQQKSRDTDFYCRYTLLFKMCTDQDFWVQDDSPIPLDIIATDSPSLPKLNSGVGYRSLAEYLQDVLRFIPLYIELSSICLI